MNDNKDKVLFYIKKIYKETWVHTHNISGIK